MAWKRGSSGGSSGGGMMVLLLCLLALLQPAVSIYCYNCRGARNNSECSQDEQLKNCDETDPNSGNHYDVCQTIIINAGQHDQVITKKCAVGPCNLDKNQNNALGLGCSGNQCSECCETDGCNISAANQNNSSSLMLMILSAMLYLLGYGQI